MINASASRDKVNKSIDHSLIKIFNMITLAADTGKDFIKLDGDVLSIKQYHRLEIYGYRMAHSDQDDTDTIFW